MNADELYNKLAGNAGKLASETMLDIDDIRHEMYLMCMEVAEGRSAYDPRIGGVHEYIMGRLWGLVRRWKRSCSLEEMTGNDHDEQIAGETIPAALHAESVEETLIQKQERLKLDADDTEDRRKLRAKIQNLTTLGVLVQSHWSLWDAANFCGMSRTGVKKRVQKAIVAVHDDKPCKPESSS